VPTDKANNNTDRQEIVRHNQYERFEDQDREDEEM
jgi:hypothetical protein